MPKTVVSASSALAAEAGAGLARDGGNAVDAAVAATIVGMVTEPGIVAAGAGSFITVWPAEGKPVVLDAYAAMPGLSGDLPDDLEFGDRVRMEYGGGLDTLVGAGSVAIPGSWAGLGEAISRYGATSWADAVAPAIRTAASGFPMSEVSAYYLQFAYDPIFSRDPEGVAYLGDGMGGFRPAGSLLHPGGLEDGLRVVAEEGPDTWYRGSVADVVLRVMREQGGWISAEDLAAYRVADRAPVMVEVGDWRVATNPPPALGGSVLAAILMLLVAEGYPGSGLHTLIDVQRSVLAFRTKHLDDHLDGTTAFDLLERAAFGDHRRLLDSPSTIHVSAVDAAGNACAITTSAGYGSGVMLPGLGMALNNSLGEIDLHPGGLHGLGPGDRLPSNMAPTILRRPDGMVAAVGSPGASRITTALAQVIAGMALEGLSLEEAVERPRLHVEEFEGAPTIAYEEGRSVAPSEGESVRVFPPHSMYFGGVGAAAWDPERGVFGVADPRRTGVVVVGG